MEHNNDSDNDPIVPLIEAWRRLRPDASRLYAAWTAAGWDENHPTYAPYHASMERVNELAALFETTRPTTIRGCSLALDLAREMEADCILDSIHDDLIERATDALHDLVERGAA
jgi:hypothetical protein